MNDQQRIDHLNTIINQYESLVWLREVFQDVAKYREAMRHQEADLKALEDACAAKQAELNGLTKRYQSKEDELELDLGETKQHYVDLLVAAKKQYDLDAAKIDAQTQTLMAQLDGAKDRLAKANAAADAAMKKQALVEAAALKAIKDYEDYKASLK